jgi:hypothetical protein
METGMDERLDSLIGSLSAQISFLRSSGLNEPAKLLEMAKLEIQLRIHTISDQELRELCSLQHGQEQTAADASPDRFMTREPVGVSSTGRNSPARVVVPMETRFRRVGHPRKHAR